MINLILAGMPSLIITCFTIFSIKKGQDRAESRLEYLIEKEERQIDAFFEYERAKHGALLDHTIPAEVQP
jgi:hypothetical protein